MQWKWIFKWSDEPAGLDEGDPRGLWGAFLSTSTPATSELLLPVWDALVAPIVDCCRYSLSCSSFPTSSSSTSPSSPSSKRSALGITYTFCCEDVALSLELLCTCGGNSCLKGVLARRQPCWPETDTEMSAKSSRRYFGLNVLMAEGEGACEVRGVWFFFGRILSGYIK